MKDFNKSCLDNFVVEFIAFACKTKSFANSILVAFACNAKSFAISFIVAFLFGLLVSVFGWASKSF